jgi:hypothetical protein
MERVALLKSSPRNLALSYDDLSLGSDLRSQSLELHAAHQAMAATLERPDEAPSNKAVGIAELPYTLRSRR